MMSRGCRFLVFLILPILLLSACGHGSGSRNNELGVVGKNLMEGITPVKRDPFNRRAFRPDKTDPLYLKGVSYGPHRKGQAPWGESPTDEQLEEDLSIISSVWHLVRIYNADDISGRILRIIRQNNLPIKVMLGVWLENETDRPGMRKNNVDNVLQAIEQADEYPEIVIGLNVGNETQVYWSAHKMEEDDLIRYIRTVRNHIEQPVTTADDYNFWNRPESKAIENEIDFITMHIHPLWNGKTLAETFDWISKMRFDIITKVGSMDVVIGEVGWATDYNADKKGDGEQGTLVKGEVGIDAQGEFLIGLDKWIEDKRCTTFLFEAFDESWKGGAESTGPNEIEKNWGVFYENRKPKESFLRYLEDKESRRIRQL